MDFMIFNLIYLTCEIISQESWYKLFFQTNIIVIVITFVARIKFIILFTFRVWEHIYNARQSSSIIKKFIKDMIHYSSNHDLSWNF